LSGRNSRIIRSRERGEKQFQINPKILIIIAIIIVIFAILMIALKNRKPKLNFVNDTRDINYEYFLLSSNENVGVIDKKGNEIIDAKYTNIYIPDPSKGVFICYEDDKVVILNEKLEEIFTNYEKVEPITSLNNYNETEKNLLKYKKDDFYGLLDFNGNVISDAIYQEITSLKDRPGRILVKQNDKYGLLDAFGNEFIEIKYDSISADEYCSDKDLYEKTGFIVAQKSKNSIDYGYIDYNGKVLLESKYETIKRALKYNNDDDIYLIVMQNGKKGVFKNGKKIIDFNFQDINYADLSDVFVANKNGKYGFYNLNGKVILKPQYTSYSIAGNYISVTKNDENKLYDIHGNLVDTASYKRMIETANPAYFIAEDDNGYYSIISKDIKIDKKYTQVSYAFDNYFIFTNEDGNTGVINALIDEIEITPKYDFIILIEGTKSLQAVDGMNNLIDIYSKDLEKTVTMEDAIVENINSEYSIIYSETDMKYINSNGEIVLNTEVYKNAKLYAIEENGKWGFGDNFGQIVINPEYDIVTELNEFGFAGIKKDGKWGVINAAGEVIIEPTYELDTYYFPQFIGKYLLNKSEIIYCEEV